MPGEKHTNPVTHRTGSARAAAQDSASTAGREKQAAGRRARRTAGMSELTRRASPAFSQALSAKHSSYTDALKNPQQGNNDKKKKSRNKETAKSERIPQPGRRCLVPHERHPLRAKVESAACATASPWQLPLGNRSPCTAAAPGTPPEPPQSHHGLSAGGRGTGAAPALPYLGLPSSATAEGASAPAARREAEGGRHGTALPRSGPGGRPGASSRRRPREPRGGPGRPPSSRCRCRESSGSRGLV